MLQEEYNAEATVHTVANAEAAALFMHLLARAQPEVQVWGLELWTPILRGSMANLAACDRWAGTAPARLRMLFCFASHYPAFVSASSPQPRASEAACIAPDYPALKQGHSACSAPDQLGWQGPLWAKAATAAPDDPTASV